VDDYGCYFYLVHNAGFQSSVVFWVGVTVQSERAPGARHIDLTKAKLYPYLQKLHGAEVCPSYNYRSSLWRQKFDQIYVRLRIQHLRIDDEQHRQETDRIT